MNNIVKIKKLYPDSILPKKHTIGAACYDLHIHSYNVDKNENVVIGFGFATEIIKGWKGIIVPRSSFTKTPFIMQNNVGIIDSDYRGEWKMKINILTWSSFNNFCNHSDLGHMTCSCENQILYFQQYYKKEDRIAQCYFEMIQDVEFEEVEELGESERGEGGYGSTNK